MKSRNAYVLGIDLGGTQVRAALTCPDGTLATPLQAVPTEAHTLERFHRFICSPARAHIRVALSSLGSAAGVIGAGALAWRKNT